MSTVYVVQASAPGGSRKIIYDVTPAEQYGQIRYVFEPGFTPSANPGRAIEIARRALLRFNSDEDFIVWAGGDPAGLLIVGVIAMQRSLDGAVRYLKWENNRDPATRQPTGGGHYIPTTFEFLAAQAAAEVAR